MGLHGATIREWRRWVIRGDSRYDDEGWHYGVMFRDGSVACSWNGSTQRQRAQEYLDRLIGEDARYSHELCLVRHQAGQPWEAVRV